MGLLLILLFISPSFANSGKFLWFSDIHLDVDYDQFGDPKDFCHANSSSSHRNATDLGEFGYYGCDTPATLFEAALESMKSEVPKPDFIVFTGGFAGHYDEQFSKMGGALEYVSRTITLVTEKIYKTFGTDTKFFPVLGAEDFPERAQFPAANNSIYDLVYDAWKPSLDDQESLRDFGYYSYGLNSETIVIGLNTNYYLRNNDFFSNGKEEDPAGQFEWLEKLLIEAAANDKKVIIIGNLSPGGYERQITNDAENEYFAVNTYNKKMIGHLQRHSHVIKMCLFGHQLIDTYRSISNPDDRYKAVGTVFVSRGLVPTNPSNEDANPAFSVVSYDSKSMEIEDIEVFYLNLTHANNKGKAEFSSEYKFKKAYDLEDMNFETIRDLTDELEDNVQLFGELYQRSTAQGVPFSEQDCDEECRHLYLCAMSSLDFDKRFDCERYHSSQLLVWMIFLIIFVVIALVVIICVCIRGRKRGYDQF